MVSKGLGIGLLLTGSLAFAGIHSVVEGRLIKKNKDTIEISQPRGKAIVKVEDIKPEKKRAEILKMSGGETVRIELPLSSQVTYKLKEKEQK